MDLLDRIKSKIIQEPYNPEAYGDYFDALRTMEAGSTFVRLQNGWLRSKIAKYMQASGRITEFYDIYKRSLLLDAPYDLDCYLLYIELNRDPKDRFYQPRRKVMKPVVDAIQALVDDDLDELFLSMPPRVGKTSLIIFTVSWLIGRDSEHPNLYSSYSDTITKAFYNGVMELITDPDTYLWHDVFPHAKVVRSNSKDETLDITRKKHYPSLTCRSIDGTLNGACDADGGVIIADDIISGIEEAMNKDRLVSKWGKVDNNLIPRGKKSTKYLWIGTRWSKYDPAGIRMELLQTDEKYATRRFKIINLPALNENDESNFNYPYGVGFDTLYYQQRRASFERNNDMASWLAQYQGEPIEREGTLFSPEDFRYFNGTLPDGDPDRVYMAVDPAFGGGDFVASPVCMQYDEDIYVVDVVYDNSDKRITIPLLVDAIKKYNVSAVQIEATKATMGYKDELEQKLKENGIKINIRTKAAPTNKSKGQRIFDKAPNIRESMLFLESGKRRKEYDLFLQNVYSFKMFAKNKNDDAPDSLSMAIDMAFGISRKPEIFKRPF